MKDDRARRRRRKSGRVTPKAPPDALAVARHEVRRHTPERVYSWMLDQSQRRQTIPIPLLVAGCEYVGRARRCGTDRVYEDLQAEVFATTGHGMPLENDKRGPLA